MKDPASPGFSGSQIRAVQILEIQETGTTPLGKPRVFPPGVIIGASPAMSSLCDAAMTNVAAAASDPRIPGVGTTYKYRSFRFRPDGSLNLKNLLPSTVTNYFLTVYDEKFESQVSGSTPPKNFATIQLEPATGAAILYRP
jgi:hypothetical protein